MKIALIGPVYPFRGGMAHYTSLLARSLLQAGHLVQVYSYKRQYPNWLYPGKSDRDPGEQTIQIEGNFILDPFAPLSWLKTAVSIAHWKPELVLMPWWTTYWSLIDFVISNYLKRHGIRVIYLPVNVLPHERRFVDRFLARLALSQGQGFLFHTHKEKEKLNSLLGGERKSVMCPMPVFDQFTKYSLSQDEARIKLNLSCTEPVVLFFGIVRAYKGLPYLIEAIHILKQKGRLAHLVVVGEFWEDVKPYELLIDRYKISDQVKLVNRYVRDDEVAIFFSAANVFVAPYTGGTQSGAIKAAMAFDIPLIITDKIADESLRTNERVLVVPAADAPAMAQGIELILDKPERWSSSACFYADKSWREMTNLIEQLAGD